MRLAQDYADKKCQPVAPAASSFGSAEAPASGAATPAAGGLLGTAPTASGGGMVAAEAAPAFGSAASPFAAPVAANTGTLEAAVAASDSGSASTGGGMFGRPASTATFSSPAATTAFSSMGIGFSFGAAQVPHHRSQSPALLHDNARSIPIGFRAAAFRHECDPCRVLYCSRSQQRPLGSAHHPPRRCLADHRHSRPSQPRSRSAQHHPHKHLPSACQG
jgi:hypothetical protein